MEEFVVITGLSGAGRSLAADELEDLGWFVIDNLPPALIAEGGRAGRRRRVAGPTGWRWWSAPGTTRTRSCPRSSWLRSTGAHVRVLFLDASTDVLVRRYESSRRRHPLSGGGGQELLATAIERERALLEPVKDAADVVVDTSDLNVHQLRDRMLELFGATSAIVGDADDGRCRSATSTACRSTSTSCSTAGSCPTRTGSTSCARSPASTSRCATTCSASPAAASSSTTLDDLLDPAAARLRGRGQGVPDDRARAAPAAATARSPSPRSWPTGCARHGFSADGVVHRDVDK